MATSCRHQYKSYLKALAMGLLLSVPAVTQSESLDIDALLDRLVESYGG